MKITDNEYNLARAYNNVGEVFKNKGELEKAIKSYGMCYKIAGSVNYLRMMGYALGNSAECLAKMGRVKEAMEKAVLKNCPFCGCKAELVGIDDQYDVRCTNISCFLSEGGGWECLSGEVIEKWNYRKDEE